MYYKAKLKKNRIALKEIETPSDHNGQFDIDIRFKPTDFLDCFPSTQFGQGDLHKSEMRSTFVYGLIQEVLHDVFEMPQYVCHGGGSIARNDVFKFKQECKFLGEKTLKVRKYYLGKSFQVHFNTNVGTMFRIKIHCE